MTIPEGFAPIPVNLVVELSSRVGRVIVDCFPEADMEFSRDKFSSKEYVAREMITAVSGRYVINAGVVKYKNFSKVFLACYYFNKCSNISSPVLFNPSSEEIRKALVSVSVDSFKKYCLEQ